MKYKFLYWNEPSTFFFSKKINKWKDYLSWYQKGAFPSEDLIVTNDGDQSKVNDQNALRGEAQQWHHV